MRQLKITKSITNRESASLDKYLQEIGREELITVEEEVELAQRIRKGDQATLSRSSISLISLFIFPSFFCFLCDYYSIAQAINQGSHNTLIFSQARFLFENHLITAVKCHVLLYFHTAAIDKTVIL